MSHQPIDHASEQSSLVGDNLPTTKDPSTFRMFLMVLRYAIPAFLTQFMALLIEVINQLFVGRLGVPAITAGVGMGHVIINIFSMSIIMGMNSAI
jgi:Na+-driven multidrug efflux pump